MKQLKRLITAIAAIAIVSSCSKSKNETASSVQQLNKKLAQTSYTYDSDAPVVEALTYDNQGRLSTYTRDDKSYNFDYSYSSLLKVTRSKKSTGDVDQTISCDLNVNGAITKMVFKDVAGNISYTYAFTYDADGYMSKVKGYNSNSSSIYEEEFAMQNGNAVSSKVYYNGVLNLNKQFSYDLTKPANGPFTTWSYWPSNQLFGKTKKNLLVELKSFDKAGAITWHTKNTYVIDAAGFPAKISTDYITDGTHGVTEYVFQ